MAQQVSIEAVLDAYRVRAGEMLHENVLLLARLSEVEAEVEQLRHDPPPAPVPS